MCVADFERENRPWLPVRSKPSLHKLPPRGSLAQEPDKFCDGSSPPDLGNGWEGAMLRSILVGLDGSDYSKSAIDAGIYLARKSGALLVGLGVVDEPTIREAEPRLIGGGVPYAEPVLYRERIADARREVELFLSQFTRRCAEAGVACKVLEDVGTPHEQIEQQAQRYDLILLGQQTRFHFETQEGYDDTVRRVLKNSPRPVITVPARLRMNPDEPGHSVLVAYDGSLQAARALHAFQTSGLAGLLPSIVVTVAAEHGDAARIAERAIDYLRFHDIKAQALPITTRDTPASVLLAMARENRSVVIVMGGYGQPILREFFIGSVTRTLLAQSPVPLFLYH
jgi:nucleotide-binding universal stress UspA family protein